MKTLVFMLGLKNYVKSNLHPKLTGEKFVFYSKGPNNIDENGIRGETAHSIRIDPSPNPSPRESPDPDDFPIWPPQEE